MDIKPANMEELTEVITAAEFHPHHCNTFVYSSSKGTIRLCDMRTSALCDRHAKCEYSPCQQDGRDGGPFGLKEPKKGSAGPTWAQVCPATLPHPPSGCAGLWSCLSLGVPVATCPQSCPSPKGAASPGSWPRTLLGSMLKIPR